jgi:hypothetical protein
LSLVSLGSSAVTSVLRPLNSTRFFLNGSMFVGINFFRNAMSLFAAVTALQGV